MVDIRNLTVDQTNKEKSYSAKKRKRKILSPMKKTKFKRTSLFISPLKKALFIFLKQRLFIFLKHCVCVRSPMCQLEFMGNSPV